MSEEVLGSMAVNEFHRFKRNIAYSLIFTSDRIIAARCGSPKDALRMTVGIKAGRIPGAAASDEAEKDKAEKEAGDDNKEAKPQINPEILLSADSSNFDIPYDEIFQIEMKKSSIGAAGRRAGKMTILTYIRKQQFDILSDQMYEDCVSLVRTVLPDKLLE